MSIQRTNAKFEMSSVSYSVTAPSRRAFQIVNELSMTVDPGRFCCLVGMSGCGKSTTLNIAGGYLPTHTGSCHWYIDNVYIPQYRPAMVFQEATLFDWMTVETNLTTAIKFSGRSGSRSAIDEILERTNLSEFRRFFPRQLSGGMRKKLELCRAWLCGCDLLLDEAFGSLDYISRQEQQQVLQQLWLREPRTIVMVTHDIPESLILADVVMVMSGPPGRISEVIDVTFDRPRTNDLRFSPSFLNLQRKVEEAVRATAVKENRYVGD